FSSRRRHTRLQGDWSSDVCSSDLSATFADTASTTNWDIDVSDSRVYLSRAVHLVGVYLTCGRRLVFPSWHNAPRRLYLRASPGRSEERRVGKECRTQWTTEP